MPAAKTKPVLRPPAGQASRSASQAASRGAPAAAPPASGSNVVPASAFEVEVWPGDDHCAYNAIRSGLIEVGVSHVPADFRAMRKVVHGACFKKETRAYMLHDGGELSWTLVQSLQHDKKTLYDLAERTEKLGRRGWAGLEEITVLANLFKVWIIIYQLGPIRWGERADFGQP